MTCESQGFLRRFVNLVELWRNNVTAQRALGRMTHSSMMSGFPEGCLGCIIWGLTPNGSCLAWSSTDIGKTRPPIILLQSSLLGVGTAETPWDVPKNWLGPSYVFDVLIHECMHIHINYNLEGYKGRSSHDCARWVRQVNRLAPLLGFGKVHAGGTKLKRVADHAAPKIPRGKVALRVVRSTTGNIPFSAVYGVLSELRNLQGTAAEHFVDQTLPPRVPRLEDLR